MVVLMHYAAVPSIEAHGPRAMREAIAAGRHLSTLAFSEAGSRSHFWAPLGTARADNGQVRLDAEQELGHLGRAMPTATSGRSRPLAAAGR